MNTTNQTGEGIRRLRQQRAWSQEHLAELCSVSVRTIQRIENGGTTSLDTLGALAAAFNLSVTELTSVSADSQTGQQDEVSSASNEIKLPATPGRAFLSRPLLTYISVNFMLLIINLLTTPGHLWFIWPLTIWGGVLLRRMVRKIYWPDTTRET